MRRDQVLEPILRIACPRKEVIDIDARESLVTIEAAPALQLVKAPSPTLNSKTNTTGPMMRTTSIRRPMRGMSNSKKIVPP